MDLRYEFDQILIGYGRPILLVRSDRKIRCSCWDEKTQSSDRECPVCFGVGYVPVIEKHSARSMDTSVPETLAMLGEQGSFGELAVPGRQYYMRYDCKVASGSLIVDVDWSPTGKPIYNGGGVYNVSHVDDKRYERGQIVYRKAYCKDEPVEKEIRGIRISSSNGIKNYEIIGG
jgi:hypothetical protein